MQLFLLLLYKQWYNWLKSELSDVGDYYTNFARQELTSYNSNTSNYKLLIGSLFTQSMVHKAFIVGLKSLNIHIEIVGTMSR